VFGRARQTDLFSPPLVHNVSVCQYYTFPYSNFHAAVDLCVLKTSSPDKRKHKTLSLSAKVEIIKKLDKGERVWRWTCDDIRYQEK
jgi:hypothetical protein